MSASFRQSSSFVRSSSVLYTTLALWDRVLYTLFLAVMKCLLSQCKYWSVCVGFLSTFVRIVLLGPGVTLMSRNGIEPSAAGSSTVNCMLGSCELMWCSSCLLCSAFQMTRVSFTHLTHRQGGCGVDWRALTLNSSMNRWAIRGANGGTHGCAMYC